MNAMTPMGGPVSTLFMTGPASGQGMDAYNAAVAPLMAMISSGEYIMDFNRTSGTPPASGLNVLFTYQVGGDNLFCWLTPGTTNVISVRYIRDSTSGSGGGAG
jgi:hypothetical protein